jgi:hypothetical protein
MPRLKNLLVIVSLAGWFASAVFSIPLFSFSFQAFLIVAAGYWLALCLLALSALARESGNGKPSFELGKKLLLSGPPTLAAAVSVGATIYIVKYRNICSLFRNCISFDAVFLFHLPRFVSDFTSILLQFYAIILIAFLFHRLMRRKSFLGEFSESELTNRVRLGKRDPKRCTGQLWLFDFRTGKLASPSGNCFAACSR